MEEVAYAPCLLGSTARAAGCMQNDRSVSLAGPFAACALPALAAALAHPYPGGIDLPQHANLFALWARYDDPARAFAAFYDVQWFTPYLLTYLLGTGLTLIAGPIWGVKLLLAGIALATPAAMIRWLRAVGGEPSWGLFGFVLAFGFSYQWGFTSFSLSLPIAFAYLTAQKRGQDVAAGALLLALFFCHAITFGLTALAGGLLALAARRMRPLLHLAPAAALVATWVILRRSEGTTPPSGVPTMERLVMLLSGVFTATVESWAVVGAGAALVIATLLFKPRPVSRLERLLPGSLAAFCLAAIPETVFATWLVGTRFLVLVHAFGLACFTPTVQGAALTRARRGLTALVIAALVATNVRLYRFNDELAGFDEVVAALPPGEDLHGYVVETGWHSDGLGPFQHGQVPAWATAQRGGFLQNDSGAYFQIPIQRRRDIGWVQSYRYVLARGAPAWTDSVVRGAQGPATPVMRAGLWALFRAEWPQLRTGDVEVVRYAQQWGALRVDRALDGTALRIAGESFAAGLASHAGGLVHVRLTRPGRALIGKLGVNDTEGQGRVIFKILDGLRRTLLPAVEKTTGQPAHRFELPLDGRRELILSAEVAPGGSNAYAHANWVELQVVD